MLSYIASENLKYRHTFTRKLLWLAPVVTLLLSPRQLLEVLLLAATVIPADLLRKTFCKA